MGKIHEQLRARRISLGLRQQDMEMRIGMPRQQYQRLESQGNPRLDTLELVAKGLRMELMLIPRERVQEVEDLLAGRRQLDGGATMTGKATVTKPSLADDPWQGLLDDEEDDD